MVNSLMVGLCNKCDSMLTLEEGGKGSYFDKLVCPKCGHFIYVGSTVGFTQEALDAYEPIVVENGKLVEYHGRSTHGGTIEQSVFKLHGEEFIRITHDGECVYFNAIWR